ncbi:zebrafish testis-expressed 38 [Megalops cyprinoides]|uniref:zebrafish testis-expressed 38 n=1 Tax=Megalops cyprinoides TaxID=118141 RepID=UPI00186440B2|nr:zebrafish testis-expressed 38 [Megalops cyprinoides]
MATAGKIRRQTKNTIEWTSLFQNEVDTQEHSLVFVKRMMALAVSSITYLRGIFPEDAYRSRYLEDLCIKLLREDSSFPGASKIVKWMMGCFHALEKGYLQIVFIGVHTDPDEPNRIIESYQFRFKYTAEGPQMEVLRNQTVETRITMEDTKKASILLIRKLFLLMQNLDALPPDVSLTMKLYYYDSVTPPDYEPPGFRPGVCDTLWFEGTAVHFKVGDVQTPFHAMKVQVAAEQDRVAKLQQGNHVRDSTQSSAQREPPRLPHRPAGIDACKNEGLPSEDESAQFKTPKRARAKGKTRLSKCAKRKRKREE